MMMWTMWRLLYVLVGVLLLAPQIVGKNIVESWAQKFEEKLFQKSKKYTALDFMKGEYERFKRAQPNDIKVTTIDGEETVKDMARKMENMLKDKVKAVKNIVNAAEKAHVRHKFNTNEDFTYFNAILINKEKTGEEEDKLRLSFKLEMDEHFNNIEVNITKSTVQVPTNVYNLAPDILSGINETESLDIEFIKNYEKDPTLTWQYFGSKYGFFRNFPGTEWETDDKGLDLYDCRKRVWYIQAATSPKDIVILMDASGSMTGLRMEIAKHTVRIIIKTLADDDFFNVLTFNTESHAIQNCFNGTLVQANADNKNLITGELENIEPRGIADFSQALKEAFTLLRDFNRTDMGANCNQAIMVITDGATEYHKDVFEKYNKDKKVRVFTYLIGREITDSRIVRQMACDNKGYYTQIATIADVEENAVKYIHVLSRPMVIEQDHNTVWTNVYMDTAVNEGLQLMTTVSQPVFNKKPDELSQGILLGVAGVDVPIIELLKLTPAYKLGTNGYPFAITNNGYLLFHPDLRPKYGENGECTNPNYKSVDLAEVELSDVDERLRSAMVNKETGSKKMDVWKYISSMHSFVLHDVEKRRIAKHTNSYYYTRLAQTPFSLGIVLSGNYGHYVLEGPEIFKKTDKNETRGDLCQITEACDNLLNDSVGTVTVAKWKYCRLSNAEVKNFTREENVINYLNKSVKENGLLDEKCDGELINHLLFDANITHPLVREWQRLFEQIAPSDEFDDRDNILLVFIGTKGGLTRTYLNPAANQTGKSMNFTIDFPNTIEEEYYQRSAEVPEDTFIYAVPFDKEIKNMDDTDDVLVTVSTALRVEKGGNTALASVLGYQMRHSSLRNLLFDISAEMQDTGCKGRFCGYNCNDSDIDCVLIDNNGYIVVSKRDDEIGTHFAFHRKNNVVFHYMLRLGIFYERELVDYQGMCEKEDDKSGAANHLLNPFFYFTSFLTWWAEQLIFFFFHLNLYHDWDESMVKAEINQHSCSAESSDLTKPRVGGELGIFEPCDQVQKFFLANPSNLPFHSAEKEECDDCSKEFSIHNISNSNLILVVSDISCECDIWDPIELAPIQVYYNETAWCDKLKRQRHRHRPETCHFQHEEENSTDCGRGSLLRPSSLMIASICALSRLINTQFISLRS